MCIYVQKYIIPIDGNLDHMVLYLHLDKTMVIVSPPEGNKNTLGF